MNQLHPQTDISEQQETERDTILFFLRIFFESKNEPRSWWPQAYCLRGPNNLDLGETGSYRTTEHTQMHNFSWKTCLSCKEPSLLSGLFQFPVWVKHRASPNLALSWKSIQENKRKEEWTSASLRSRLSLEVSRQFNLLIYWQAYQSTSVEIGKRETWGLSQAAPYPHTPSVRCLLLCLSPST